MRLCNESITVLNKRVVDGQYAYYPSTITGVSWYSDIASSVGDKGLVAANRVTIRVPVDADFNGKQYVDPKEYKSAVSVDGVFTFAQGDVIVRAVVVGDVTPEILHGHYADCMTVLGVTDNRRAPNAPHWKVVGS